MTIPRYYSWCPYLTSEEEKLARVKETMMPAISRLSDGSLLTNISADNPWLFNFFSEAAAHDEIDAAYRTSPNEMTMTLIEFVDIFYGTICQRRTQERLVNLGWYESIFNHCHPPKYFGQY